MTLFENRYVAALVAKERSGKTQRRADMSERATNKPRFLSRSGHKVDKIKDAAKFMSKASAVAHAWAHCKGERFYISTIKHMPE